MHSISWEIPNCQAFFGKFPYSMYMKIFGERLRELRTEKGLTQKQLAQELQVNHASIVDWEIRDMEPAYETLVKIVKFFDVSADYLLGLRDYD